MKNIIKGLFTTLFIFSFTLSGNGQGWVWDKADTTYFKDAVFAENGDIVGIANMAHESGFTPSEEGKIFRFTEHGDSIFLKKLESNLGFKYLHLLGIAENNGSYFISGLGYNNLDPFTLEGVISSFYLPVNKYHSVLIRVDENGKVIWEQTLDAINEVKVLYDILAEDNTITVCGQVTHDSLGRLKREIILSRYDLNGNELWSKRFERNGTGLKLLMDKNKDLIIGGATEVNGDKIYSILKTDSDGKLLNKFHSNKFFRYPNTIIESNSGGYYSSGYRRLGDTPLITYIFKHNHLGDTIRTITINNSTQNILEIFENEDYSLSLLGQNSFFESKIITIDTLGTILNEKTIPFGGNVFLKKNNFIYSVGGSLSQNTTYTGHLGKFHESGFIHSNKIFGNYLLDNSNCNFDQNDKGIQKQIIELSGEGQTSFTTTERNGSYEVRTDSGSYTLKTVAPNPYWELCSESQLINFNNIEQTNTTHFFANKTTDCPYLTVNTSTPRMRRCFDNQVYVNYCNSGTIKATDSYIEVTLDPRLTATTATLPWTSQTGNTFRFDIGNVEVNQCGDFQITTTMNCDSVQLGQTLCLEAHIYPDTVCMPPDSLWDGSDLMVKSICEGDSVKFEVINNGNTMSQEVDFIIIEDDMVMRVGTIQPIAAATSIEEKVPAEGATYRFEVDQPLGHPWNQKATAFIEACGTNPIGTFSTGFATTMPQFDDEPYFDRECVEVRGAYDPNDKEGFPKGVCNRKFIFNDTELEYKVRFQNTGTDTAFRVEIRDTLAQHLDPMSLQIINASHNYDWNIVGQGILIFTFDDIMLPDSNINEAASHGFIQYKIDQKVGNMIDDEIENSASIYFDFNAPIKTNTVRHTVGDDFLTRELGDLTIAGKVTRESGAPIDSALVFLSDNCFTYTNSDGDYLFENIEEGEDYTIRVMKDDDHRKGVNIFDLVAMRNYILFRPNGGLSFYQKFAADVSSPGGGAGVSTFDLAIESSLILGVIDSFRQVSQPWYFFNKEFDPNNPTPGLDEIKLLNLQANSFSNNFIGVKMGDVVQEDRNVVGSDTTQIKFRDSQIGVCGPKLLLDLDFYNPNELVGVQFSVKWDSPILEFDKVIVGPSFGIYSLNPTELNFSTLFLPTNDSSKLILEFNVLGDIGDEVVLEWDTDGLEPLFVDSLNTQTPFRFDPPTTIEIKSLNSLTITPNITPATNATSNDGSIDVSNISGGSGNYAFYWPPGNTSPQRSNLAPGNYLLIVTDLANGCQESFVFTIGNLSGVANFPNSSTSVKLSPNPIKQGSEAYLEIKSASRSEFGTSFRQMGNIEIHDLNGKLIKAFPIQAAFAENKYPLQSDLPKGTYLVSVFLEKEGKRTLRWVVQ